MARKQKATKQVRKVNNPCERDNLVQVLVKDLLREVTKMDDMLTHLGVPLRVTLDGKESRNTADRFAWVIEQALSNKRKVKKAYAIKKNRRR